MAKGEATKMKQIRYCPDHMIIVENEYCPVCCDKIVCNTETKCVECICTTKIKTGALITEKELHIIDDMCVLFKKT